MRSPRKSLESNGLRAVLAVVVIAMSLYVVATAAADTYDVIDLGKGTSAYAINNAGKVIGTEAVGGRTEARLWHVAAHGAVTPYDLQADIDAVSTLAGHTRFYAQGINDLGQIAGYASNGAASTDRAFHGSPSGGSYDITDLQTTFASDDFRRAYDINNAGLLVGYIDQPGGPHDPWPQAVVVDTTEAAPSAAVLNMGTHPHTTPYAISNTGQVAGYCEQNPRYYAANWDSSSASLEEMYPVAASDLTGTTYSLSSWAYDVNDGGVAVGRSRGASLSSTPADYVATLWDTTESGSPAAVNLDPTGVFQQSHADGINALGQVVGWGDLTPYNSSPRDYHAFIWEGSAGIVDLNTLIDPNSGWILMTARAINDSGWIVGYGALNGEGRAFAMQVPEPTALAMLGLGGLALIRRRR
jgi:probable HAF family extracellular repeat protein